jgi:hypothetical protein
MFAENVVETDNHVWVATEFPSERSTIFAMSVVETELLAGLDALMILAKNATPLKTANGAEMLTVVIKFVLKLLVINLVLIPSRK